MMINTHTHKWSTCREKEMFGHLQYTSPPLPTAPPLPWHKKHCGRWGRKTVRARGNGVKQQVIDTPGKLYMWIHSACDSMFNINRDKIPAMEKGVYSWGATCDRRLLREGEPMTQYIYQGRFCHQWVDTGACKQQYGGERDRGTIE